MVSGIPTLDPIASLEIQASPTGSVHSPYLQFAGDSLFVVSPEWNQWTASWFLYHAPTAIVLVSGICALLLVRQLVRARFAGRVVGRVYCRRCRHELVEPQIRYEVSGHPVWADASSRCPECGRRDLLWRWPRAWRRIALPIATLLLVVIGAFAGLRATTTMPDPSRLWSDTLRWPFPELAIAAPKWKLSSKVQDHELKRGRVSRVSLLTGGIEHLFRSGRFANPSIASDGGRVVAQSCGHAPKSVRFLDRKTGEVRTVRVAEFDDDFVDVMGFSRDERSVYVRRLFTTFDRRSAVQPRSEVLAINVETGQMSSIARSVFPRTEIEIAGWTTARAVDDDKGLRWFFAFNQLNRGGPERMLGVVGTPSGESRYWISPAPFILTQWEGDPESIPLDDSNPVRIMNRDRWIFKNGTRVTEPARGQSPKGGDRIVISPGSIASNSSDVGVSDVDATAPFAALRLRAQPIHWWVSPDGRYVAALVSANKPSWVRNFISTWPPDRSAKLLVWDLQQARGSATAP